MWLKQYIFWTSYNRNLILIIWLWSGISQHPTVHIYTHSRTRYTIYSRDLDICVNRHHGASNASRVPREYTITVNSGIFWCEV